MKTLAFAIVTASFFTLPVASFAQSTQSGNAPLTRAEVRAQLVQLEQVGYVPSSSRHTYPTQIQAAEAKVAAQSTNQEYGAGTNGSVQSGAQTAPANPGE